MRILQFGFSNISPSPTTLEITQLELLASEKHELYDRFRAAGLSEEAAVALVSGAVVAVHPEQHEATRAGERREQHGIEQAIDDLSTEEDAERRAEGPEDPLAGDDEEE